MTEQTFDCTLEATGGTTTGFRIPDDVVVALGGGGRPPVTASAGGHSWRGSIARMGGEYWLGVSAERRASGGLTAGLEYTLSLRLDTASREVDLPDDLAAALAEHATARAFWETLSFSKQQWHVTQVTGAKKAETRAARVQTSIEMLAAGIAR